MPVRAFAVGIRMSWKAPARFAACSITSPEALSRAGQDTRNDRGGDPVVEPLDVVEGLLFGLHVVEIGKPLQVCPEVVRRQGTLETAPPDLPGLIGSPERFQRIDPGVLPLEAAPGRVSVLTVFGCLRSL